MSRDPNEFWLEPFRQAGNFEAAAFDHLRQAIDRGDYDHVLHGMSGAFRSLHQRCRDRIARNRIEQQRIWSD